ncbi:hypothetical protein ACH6CV_13845, partial [Bacillota bacterium Meth-B3]
SPRIEEHRYNHCMYRIEDCQCIREILQKSQALSMKNAAWNLQAANDCIVQGSLAIGLAGA